MDQKTFVNLLQNNKPDEILDFLLHNGKKPKPISPFYFISKEEREETENGKLDD